MPTGYTAKLMEEGQSFQNFVMTCARAMGATIMMRDEPLVIRFCKGGCLVIAAWGEEAKELNDLVKEFNF